jgi:hypothetical protein
MPSFALVHPACPITVPCSTMIAPLHTRFLHVNLPDATVQERSESENSCTASALHFQNEISITLVVKVLFVDTLHKFFLLNNQKCPFFPGNAAALLVKVTPHNN